MNKMNKSFKGFGLIEVVVATALLGILSLGVAGIIQLTTRSAKTAAQNQEVAHLITLATKIFSDNDTCRTALMGLPVSHTVNAPVGLGPLIVGGIPVFQYAT